jgi:hypothetical protein
VTKNPRNMTLEDLLHKNRSIDSGSRLKPPEGGGVVCAKCNERRPAHLFRRWHGSKRLVFKVCSICHPEKTIYEMTEDQLITWLNVQNAPKNLIPAALKARQERLHLEKSMKYRGIKADDWMRRREALWMPVLAQISAESDRWRASNRSIKDVSPHNTAKAQFINAYLPILGELSQKIRRLMKLGDPDTPGASSERVLPGVEKQTMLVNVVLDLVEDWPILISDTDLRNLAGLWSECAVDWPRGRRVIEPAFIRGIAR